MDAGEIGKGYEFYRQSKAVCVLTGAGVSAESGVPTFRGKEGLWKNYSATELATPEAFSRDPVLVWEWYQWRRELIRSCDPNPSHTSIALMEREKEDFLLITQNVDGLHKKSGSRLIVEIHGNIWEVRCLACNTISIDEDDFDKLPPECELCGGMLRPNIVWFGESIPPASLERSFASLTTCDLLIVAGTSGYVQPAASFAQIAAKSGARVIEINVEGTPNSDMADLFIMGNSGEILPALIKKK